MGFQKDGNRARELFMSESQRMIDSGSWDDSEYMPTTAIIAAREALADRPLDWWKQRHGAFIVGDYVAEYLGQPCKVQSYNLRRHGLESLIPNA